MGQDKKTENRQTSPWRAFGIVGVIGVELSVLLLVGIWIGRKADLMFQTSPFFLIIGMILGLVIGIWSVIKLLKPFLGD